MHVSSYYSYKILHTTSFTHILYSHRPETTQSARNCAHFIAPTLLVFPMHIIIHSYLQLHIVCVAQNEVKMHCTPCVFTALIAEVVMRKLGIEPPKSPSPPPPAEAPPTTNEPSTTSETETEAPPTEAEAPPTTDEATPTTTEAVTTAAPPTTDESPPKTSEAPPTTVEAPPTTNETQPTTDEAAKTETPPTEAETTPTAPEAPPTTTDPSTTEDTGEGQEQAKDGSAEVEGDGGTDPNEDTPQSDQVDDSEKTDEQQ